MEEDNKGRMVLLAGLAWFFIWCCGTAALFGLAVSTILIWISLPFVVAWEVWYLYYK